MNNIEIAIGEKIKLHRKQRNITQEQLAEYLNISFQSVSKWERGEAYPDIIMIPKIALFFNVTTDELLCMDNAKVEQEIEEYFKRQRKAESIGYTKEAIEILREANAKYPGNFKIMQKLAGAIFFDYCASGDEEYKKNAQNEILSIGEKIRAECKDDNIRRDVLQLICFVYGHKGEKDKAKKLVLENLGGVYLTQEMMLGALLEGDELAKHRQAILSNFLSIFCGEITALAKDFAPEDKITAYENILKIYSVIYPDGDFGFCHLDVSSKYMDIAVVYLNQGDNAKVVENIKKAAEHVIIFDNLIVPMPHTSPLVNKLEYTGITTNAKGNKSFHLLERLEHEGYNAVRDMSEFKEICEDLKRNAKEDLRT